MTAVAQALGRVLEHEVPGVLQPRPASARELAAKRSGAGERRERVAPRPTAAAWERRAPPGAPRKARASRSRPSGRARACACPCAASAKPPSRRRAPRRRHAGETGASIASKPSRVMPVHELLPGPGRAQPLGQPVPLAVGEEAGAGDHQRAHGVGVVAGPAQPDQPAPVVHDERDALRGRPRAGTAPPPRPDAPTSPGRVRRGESPKPGRSGATARQPASAHRGQHRPPHVRRLGHAVQQERLAHRGADGLGHAGGQHQARIPAGGAVRSSASQPTSRSRRASSASPPPRRPKSRLA